MVIKVIPSFNATTQKDQLATKSTLLGVAHLV